LGGIITPSSEKTNSGFPEKRKKDYPQVLADFPKMCGKIKAR